MKTFTHINKIASQAIFVTLILLSFSCGTTQNTDRAVDSKNLDGTRNTFTTEGARDTRSQDGTINTSNRGGTMDSVNPVGTMDSANPVGTMDSADRRGTMGTSNRAGTMDSTYENNEINTNQNEQDQDRHFLVSTAANNLKQIQAGQLAQQNGQTEQVRELGKMMEDAHSQSQKDLTALAERKMISVPTTSRDDSQDDFDELMNESSDDFDKAYTDMMISMHEDSIEAFEQASHDSKDSDIRKWATATLPDLRKHLKHSQECQGKISTMTLEKN